MEYRRECNVCRESKQLNEFYVVVATRKDGSRKPAMQRRCKGCNSSAGKASQKRGVNGRTYLQHKRYEKWRWPKAEHGLTYEQWLARMCEVSRRDRSRTGWRMVPSVVRPKGETPAEYYRRRYHTDPAFRMQEIVKAQVRKAIRPTRRGSRRTLDFLGYDRDELHRHIERQFPKGMSWDDVYAGRVHIDHVVPKSSFNLADPDEVRRAWALPNLRPIWVAENMRKAARREFLL